MNEESEAVHQDKQRHQRRLLASLFAELFQSERSAMKHPRREAARLGNNPPAQALRDVAAHARRAVSDLEEVARENDLAASRIGVLAGEALSTVRTAVFDRLVDVERSYRGTLLGLRHGIDLVKLIRRVADASGLVEIGGACTRWLDEREPLVERVETAMAWFADHPRRAAIRPRAGLLRRRGRAGARRAPAAHARG